MGKLIALSTLVLMLPAAAALTQKSERAAVIAPPVEVRVATL